MRLSSIVAGVSGFFCVGYVINIVTTWNDYRITKAGGHTQLPYKEGDFAGLFLTNGLLLFVFGLVLLCALAVRFDH